MCVFIAAISSLAAPLCNPVVAFLIHKKKNRLMIHQSKDTNNKEEEEESYI